MKQEFSMVAISEVASVFNGKTPSKDEQRYRGHPVLKIKDISDQGVFKGLFESYVDQGFVDKFKQKLINEEDILILNAAHNADYVGTKIYKADKNVKNALATGEWTIIRVNKSVLDPSFAYYWMLNGRTRHEIKQLVKGIHLYPKDILRLTISLPPLEEQKRIAAILDKADEIRRKRQEAIRLTEELVRSLFLDMFGDPVTNPKEWEVFKLGNLVKIKGGGTPDKENLYYWGGDIPWASVKDITSLELENTQDFITEEGVKNSSTNIIPANTVLIITRMAVGRVCITKRDIAINQDIKALFCSDKLLPEYLLFFLVCFAKNLQKYESGSTVKGITLDVITQIKFPLPPLEKQQEFVSRQNYIKLCIKKSRNSFNQSDNLFQSLLQKAFRGEL